MEKFQELGGLANKKLKIADYMLTMTYPLVKDPKLLLSVIENLFLACSYSISSLLHYERLFKRIPPFPDNFAGKFELFRQKCSNRYGIDNEHLKMVQEIKEIIIAHRKSPMEFPRRDSLVICNGDFRIKTISADIVKSYVGKAKLFISKLSTIVSKDESIFR